MQKLTKIKVKTKWGTFLLEFTEKGLFRVRFPRRSTPSTPGVQHRTPGVSGVQCFCEYFAEPRGIIRLRLDLTGCTSFQQSVYRALMKVPAGHVITYGELAKRAGYPGAARAVGTAMKKNHLPIVIPCHRVVPSFGGIGAYSVGVKWKRRLLQYEGHNTARS